MFKIFEMDTKKKIAGLEREMNNWLVDNPDIKVKSVSQSETSFPTGAYNYRLTVIVYYEGAKT